MIGSSLHVEWSSSLRCPHHNEPVDVIVDHGLGIGRPHIAIVGCCSGFVRTVEGKMQSLLKADVHAMTRPRQTVPSQV